MVYDLSFKNNKVDYLLATTAMLQPILTLIQLFMQDALHYEPVFANTVRVMATALPVLLSMIFVAKRNFKITAFVFAIAIMVIMLTTTIYPHRWTYMRDDVLKFTLPVVIPIGLCIASIRNFPVLIKTMQYISVSAAVVGMLYAMMYLRGEFYIDGYSMPFSYALLFPTFVMASRKNILWKGVVLILMLEMLAVGSRGALILSVGYFIYSFFKDKISIKRMIFFGMISLFVYFFFFDSFILLLSKLFELVGIKSRTLILYMNEELISHDSGRYLITQKTWELIEQNPILGSGVWADREYLDMYCHNVFLELLLDFGYLGGSLIILAFFYRQIGTFKRLPKSHRSMYIMMIGVLCPLVVSSSYLISFNTGMFLGFSYLQRKLNKQGLYQEYVFE